MKTKYIVGCLVYAIFTCIFAFTADIAKTTFTFPLSDIFPSPSNATTNNGIDNIKDYVIGMIPLLTTLMAIGATVMVVLGGFHMVLGGARTDQNEKGKGILKDAVMGLLVGLLAYVIIMTLGNILGV